MKKSLIFLIILSLLSAGSGAVAYAVPKDFPRGERFKRSGRNRAQSKSQKKQPARLKVALGGQKTPELEKSANFPNQTPTPVPLVSTLEDSPNPNLLSGNRVVTITSNSNAVLTIGLSPHGMALIDFPANDPIYEIHPADENFVTVGCRRREAVTDAKIIGRCLDNPKDGVILRPGSAFNQWQSSADPSTVVTIQRVSGLVVSLIVVPVKQVSQNTNYLVINYDAERVAEARAAAGLSHNLIDLGKSTIPGSTTSQPPSTQVVADNNYVQVRLDSGESANSASANDSAEDGLYNSSLAALNSAKSSKPVLRFGKPVHGLSLAVASHSNGTGDNSIDVIAVRNVLDIPLRLLPDQPNLVIETAGEKDSKGSILTKDVTVDAIYTDVKEGDILAPGEIYYFAFSYKTPSLGARQYLSASFAHRAANDEPATIVLSRLIK